MQEVPCIPGLVAETVLQSVSGEEEEHGDTDMPQVRSDEAHVDPSMEQEYGQNQDGSEDHGVLWGESILTADTARNLHGDAKDRRY